ncbi:LacI family DNA-binding transcriptional regulator [Streptomyces sp. ME19-01-6]|uniref:LacI family DNA-binding transcriptional regulator n=1 Tax=Streptomyces sp. ME19-01-6 TaxID=3028686 RepID=UPI0029A6BFF2|nr:LacI family DNA-binding transcriptional regulator [Streptomyces sp. ME19-01-6]MDX3228919.1 LacI family DNA-binding transcriptional regulator [Streptomyces sp. ME19-01-6]
MPERRVTMADVARRAGVSPTTASFALSGRTDMRISAASRERVLEAARELGYRPNVTARSLRTKSTQTIGFVSDRITTTPFAGDVIRGAMEAARQRDNLLFITEAGGDRAAESSLVHALLDRQVDAVIYASMFTRYVTPPKELFGRRVVLLNCLADFDAPSVVPDELEAGRDAARALLAAGHTEGIWAIGGHQAVPATPEGIIAGNERMRGLEEVLRAGGARLDGVIECDWDTRDGHREVTALLTAGHRPRALVCLTDRVSFGAYQALGEAGLSVPGDVSVVSFDDQDIASVLRPALTTLKLPHYQLGRLAVELILGEGPLEAAVHRVPMPLQERASIGAPAEG